MGTKGMMNVPFIVRSFSKSAGPQTFYVVEGFTAGTLLAALDKVGDTVGLMIATKHRVECVGPSRNDQTREHALLA